MRGISTVCRLACLQPVFSLRVTLTPEIEQVFSYRERKRAVWQYGRVWNKVRREKSVCFSSRACRTCLVPFSFRLNSLSSYKSMLLFREKNRLSAIYMTSKDRALILSLILTMECIGLSIYHTDDGLYRVYLILMQETNRLIC